MYEGSSVKLKMEKVITLDGLLDEKEYECKVFKYDAEEDYIYFDFSENELPALSLDAKYGCEIITKKEILSCSGIVKERFQSEEGQIVSFKIENGFYKVQSKKRALETK